MKNLIGFLSVLLMTVAVSALERPGSPLSFEVLSPIKALELQNLDSYRGMYLTVLYGTGRASPLDVSNRDGVVPAGTNLHLKEILAIYGTLPIQSDKIEVPTITLKVPLYFVALVIHEQPNFVWSNPDNSTPSYTIPWQPLPGGEPYRFSRHRTFALSKDYLIKKGNALTTVEKITLQLPPRR